jgi:DNA mismatch repair protein MutS
MQCGDFYEFFADDAETVADELDLKLSEKSSHGSSYPMAGVPVDDLTPYLVQLVERGYRVAVADQRETEGGIVREIERVVTPGTMLEGVDDGGRYLAALAAADDGLGLAFADVTTGRFHVADAGDADGARSECTRFDPAELLVGPGVSEAFADALSERVGATVASEEEAFAPGAARHAVRDQFGEGALDSLDVGADAVRAAGAALSYLDATGAVTGAFTRLQPERDSVALDATTRRNLEVTETMGEGGRSLFDTIDRTVTAAGRRRLKEWLCRPRRDTEELERRLDCVAALAGDALARERVRDLLAETHDLERLASRAAAGRAGPRDLARIREALARLPDLAEAVETHALADSPLPAVVARADRGVAADLREELAAALVEDPPDSAGEGTFRQGYDDDLDDLIERHEAAADWIDGLAERERERHGITHLQVGRNATDGYYIQVGNSETDAVPGAYREVKTLKNSKRYTTDALEEKERAVLRAEEQRAARERELFAGLVERVGARADLLQTAGRALAELDALSSFAEHAVAADWVRPEFGGEGVTVEAGRHPVVEQSVEFVPNDARLDRDRRFLVVTGPNMSGKSTYMRQTALVVLLAQVGSFVPAERARVDPVDGIYTRVGALDELAGGRSTFMVEMQELSRILHAAGEDSLVVLDEVGRGTATYDGISIAWAATEYLHNEVGAFALFATHYHELTALADSLPAVENAHVEAEEQDGEVTFLRTVAEGATDRSYGVHVADLAGVPDPVVDRSAAVLDRLREEKAIEARGGGTDEPRQVVFDLGAGEMRTDASADGGDPDGEPAHAREPAAESVLAAVESLDVNETPPVELAAKVQEWQETLSGE